MKGYIYTMFAGADPGAGWIMTDPILRPRPTFGACMPNIRRSVVPGDHIFVISGRVNGLRQYVVGGFEVDEKISALAAYQRFPENRMREEGGRLSGNIVVRADGTRNPVDYHDNFAQRVQNYVVGKNPAVVDGDSAIAKARDQTLPMLSRLFERQGNSVYSVLGRWRRLDPDQIEKLYSFVDVANRG
jgi:hypothetical protein